jgi:hypothetical protein
MLLGSREQRCKFAAQEQGRRPSGGAAPERDTAPAWASVDLVWPAAAALWPKIVFKAIGCIFPNGSSPRCAERESTQLLRDAVETGAIKDPIALSILNSLARIYTFFCVGLDCRDWPRRRCILLIAPRHC